MTDPRSVRSVLALAAALAGATALLVAPRAGSRSVAPGPVTAAVAWRHAERADIPAQLPDGQAYQPAFFLDARTSVGTAASPDRSVLRLVLRAADGSVRELRGLPAADTPFYGGFAVGGDDLAWAETTDRGGFSLWTVDLRDGTPARRLTADAGAALFYGTQHDLVIAGGRVHWAAAGPQDAGSTQIRSVALAGGAVEVRTEAGSWALSAWPWIVDGVSDPSGTTRLRALDTGRDVAVAVAGGQSTNCGPTWCRVLTPVSDGTTRIDLIHPDGSDRRRVAGGAASAALTDVAPLDRFEVLSEPGPTSDLTGTARLSVYDIAARRTVEIHPDVGNAGYGNGVLWWTTGVREAVTWHTIDLRTV